MSIPFVFGRLIVVADMSWAKTSKLSHLKQESSGDTCQVADMVGHLNGCLAINIACDVLCTSLIFNIPLPWSWCSFQAGTREREVRSAEQLGALPPGIAASSALWHRGGGRNWYTSPCHVLRSKYSQIQVWQKLSRFGSDFTYFSDFKVWCYCLDSDRDQSKS